MSVIPFPVLPKNIRGKNQMAWWLRELADLIEEDKLQVMPEAALLLLVGDNSQEFLHVGGLSPDEKRKALLYALNSIS